MSTPSTPAPIAAPARTVLVVDDEDAIRVAVRLTLEDEGYAVEEVADGRAALERLLGASAPLVAVLDLMLPFLSGVRLLQMAGGEPRLARHRYVVVTAARAFPAADLARYLPPGHLTVVAKPFAIDHLAAEVERAGRQLLARAGAAASSGRPRESQGEARRGQGGRAGRASRRPAPPLTRRTCVAHDPPGRAGARRGNAAGALARRPVSRAPTPARG